MVLQPTLRCGGCLHARSCFEGRRTERCWLREPADDVASDLGHRVVIAVVREPSCPRNAPGREDGATTFKLIEDHVGTDQRVH
eukprot:SAG31_NODE_1493_length_8110_cov_1.991020_5_plen_83_part_00